MTFIEGIDRCALELISNAVDNCTYSIYCGRRPDEIHVTLTDTTITVVNGGSNVPVDKMPGTNTWVPSMLWGSLFSSSHYEESRRAYKASTSSAGTNGVGGALVNIFSERFEVTVDDPESHQRYHNVWCRGKPLEVDGVPVEPTVTRDPKIVDTRISVSYTLDFPFFNIEKYSQDMMEVIAYHVVTAGFTAKVPVTITNAAGVSTRYDVRLISDYAALFPELKPSENIKRLEYHVLSPEAIAKSVTYADAILKQIEIPRIEALIIDELIDDDPQESETEEAPKKRGNGVKGKAKAPVSATSRRSTGAFQLSFVNGIITTQGGVHVDELIKAFFGEALTELNISLAHGKRHISFLLSVRVSDPKFREQAKRTLTAPRPSFEGIPAAILKALRGWETMTRLKALNEAVRLVELKKTDGKKLRRVTAIKELDDANDAGTSRSQNCTLIIVEGSSAATYPEILRDQMPNGRDTHGILLLRGKPFNAINAKPSQLARAQGLYAVLKQAFGLQDGLDYSVAVNFRKLRYGHALIATDADCDGWHILGLVILMFHTRFPSLVHRGYLSFLRTPVLRIPGSQSLTFFTKRAYEEWKTKARLAGGAQAILAKRKPKYFKGLGSSSEEHVKEDYRSKRGELALHDKKRDAKEALDLGFNGKRTDDRKVWLSTPVVGDFLDTDESTESIAHFVDTGLKFFSFDNVHRAIPSVMDGLKEAPRKALSAGIKKFGLGAGNRHASLTRDERRVAGLKSATSSAYVVPPEAKVFQIIGFTTEHYCYHHGEPILGEVIANMCKKYVGTNNVTWFEPVSSFGTIDTGKAPNARYASLGPAWWWSYVFNPADSELVEHVYDEDIKCEAHFMLPVACWALCNHADGVGTGYSTKIPGHNIEEVVLAHLALLDGHGAFPALLPWWRGFRGNVSLVPRSTVKRMAVVEDTISEEDVEGEDGKEDLQDEVEEEEDDEELPAPPVKSKAVRKPAKTKPCRVKSTGASDEGMVCVVDGLYTLQGNMVIVTALPLYTLSDFKNTLTKLIDKKIVSDFRNLTTGESIRFEIEMAIDEKTGKMYGGNLMKLFRLRRVISMGNMVLLDEKNLPKRFQSAEHILHYFHDHRLGYYEKRRIGIAESLREKVVHLDRRMRLVKALVVESPDRIVYANRPKSEVLSEITAKLPDVPHAIYNELHVKNLNQDEIISLGSDLTAARNVLADVETTTKEAMWKKDLLIFLKEYRAIYGSTLSEPFKALGM